MLLTRKKTMKSPNAIRKIRYKILAIISIAMVGLILLLHFVATTVVLSGYSELEQNDMKKDLEMLQKTIYRDEGNLHSSVVDWGMWNETYDFVSNGDRSYIDSNLGNEVFDYLGVDVLVIVNLDHQVVLEMSYLTNGSVEPEKISSTDEFMAFQDTSMNGVVGGNDKTGLLWLPQGPMMVSSTAVLRSGGSGPANGIMLMGQWLDTEEIGLLEDLSSLNLQITTMDDPLLEGKVGEDGLKSLQNSSVFMKPLSDDTMGGYLSIPDIGQQKAIIFEASEPRDIFQQGKSIESFLITALTLSGIFFGLVTILLLETSIVSRMSRLSDDVSEIAASGDPSNRVKFKGGDEVAELANNINGMLLALDSAQTKLVENERGERDKLEGLVNQRTEALVGANTALQAEISERERTERDLRESETRYRAVVEDQTDFIERIRPDRTITFVNQAYGRYIGREAGELIGSRFDLDATKEDAQKIDAMLAKISPMTPVVSYQYQVRKSTGEVRWLNWTSHGIFDEGGGLVEIQSVGSDITDRIKLEQELFKVQKLESLGRLAGGIAHDFNNVMTSIVGNITIVKMDPGLSEAAARRLLNAESSVMRARNLSDQLLTFSEGGAPVKEQVSTADLIRSAAEATVRGGGAFLRFTFPEDLMDIEVDMSQIGMAVQNMVRNAIEASPQGGLVRISAQNLKKRELDGLPLQPGLYVMISIQDDGQGIPKEHLPFIFDPFYTTKKNASGLGLTAAASIAMRHGGYLDVETEYAKGSLFHLYLPAIETASGAKALEGKELGECRGRILLMDDESSIQDVVKELLMLIGYEVTCAGDGAEALQEYSRSMARGAKFDLVIMDLTVPGGMGGKETIRRLLEMDPEAKAVVSSGYSNDPVMSEYAHHGFKDLLQKPYSFEELRGVVRRTLRPS